MHVHSWASDKPAIAAFGLIDAPECYSPPEKVYDQAVARGMDFVTITDHDTIRGGMELADRGFQRFILGQEVTVYFPEDRCKLHVLVWGLSPKQAEELDARGLRSDVYEFAHWLRANDLAHSLAHPLYVQNRRLSRWHVERCVLLFRCFECLNGAHIGRQSDVIAAYLDALTAQRIADYESAHSMRALWPEPWRKGRTGGSDDHGLLNIGCTWTEAADRRPVNEPREFLDAVMAFATRPGGVAGHSSLLAHQYAKVTSAYAAQHLLVKARARGRYAGSKLLRFAGVEVPTPSKRSLVLDTMRKRLAGRRSKTEPLIQALRDTIKPLLEQYPELKDRLDPATWDNGAPIASHERMAAFIDDLTETVTRAMAGTAKDAIRLRDRDGIVSHLISYLLLVLGQAPYIVSLFYQNKDRMFTERFENETAAPGSGLGVLERPLKVCLFTDTLADVNGVCRFIRNVGSMAAESERDLTIFTSTKKSLPSEPWIRNFDPVFSRAAPKYDTIQIVLPPVLRMLRAADELQPDAIHISTPGPVGMVGFLAARMLRVPMLGVYHTDFPAYIDHLFDDSGCTWIAQNYMQFFYRPFHTVFTRSDDYVRAVARLGVPESRIERVTPGVDTTLFSPDHRDESCWASHPEVPRDAVKVLYVGRISIEKNLPFLVKAWKRARAAIESRGGHAHLVVVGGGPYEDRMREETAGLGVSFIGFKHGKELSAIYASSDFLVFPSKTDTLGQVVMESMASGIPVLVTNIGGPQEVVDDGVTGLVLADDVDTWSRAITDLTIDHARRRRMGEAALAHVAGKTLRHSFEDFWKAHVRARAEHLASHEVENDRAGPPIVEFARDKARSAPAPGE